ncbi:MAG: NHL repeat-containing protein, partial [Terracidiphilus sp.]
MTATLDCHVINPSPDQFTHFPLRDCFDSISRSLRIVVAFLVLTLLCGPGISLNAQTAHFSGYTTNLYTGNYSTNVLNPVGVVMDANHDIFVADAGNAATGGSGFTHVWEITPNGSGGYNTPVSLAAGTATSSPYIYIYGVTLDSNRNLWFTDYGCGAAPTSGSTYCSTNGNPAGAVWEIPYSAGNYNGTPAKITATWGAPYGVAADTSGNVFITDFKNNSVSEVASGGSSATTLGGTVPAPRRLTVDAAGNLYVISSTGLDIYKLSAPGYATAAVLGTATFNTPVGIAIDPVGNLWVTDPYRNALEEATIASGYADVQEFARGGSGIPLEIPMDAFFDGNGTFIVADSYSGLDSIEQINVLGIDAGQPQANVGTIGRTLQFEFNSAGTIKAPLVLTSGIASLDYVDAGTGSCTTQGTSHSYVSGETCTVNVNFTPKISGSLYGAVDLLNGSGAVIAQAYLYGGGTGPQLIYVAPASDVPATLKSTFGMPMGLSVSRNGANVFVADNSAGAVDVISGSTVTAIGGSFTKPAAVAVDGAGNVFVADSGSKTISEIPYNGTTWGTAVSFSSLKKNGVSFTFADPIGIAVDADDDIFVADGSGAAVYEILQASNYTIVNQIASSFTFSNPAALGFDGDGNLYVADSGAGAIYELTSASKFAAPAGALVSGLTTPTGLAVDGAANLFFISGTKLQEFPVGGSITTLASGLAAPYGIAVDLGRNIYLDSDNLGSNNPVLKLDYVDPPTLNFASTSYLATSSDSPQLVIVENVGTGSGSAITLTANPTVTTTTAGAGGSFTSDASTTCSSTTTLAGTAAGSICNIGVDFVPQAVGSIAGTVTLTDSYTGSPQTINLAGTAIKANQTTLTVTGMPGTPQMNGSNFTVGSSGGSGTGAVTFAASGACSNTSGGALITMISGTGTCSVTATKAADADYNIATSAPATVAATLATQATLTVTGVPGTAQAYGATFTVSSSGGSGTGTVTFAASGACSNTAGGALITMSATSAAATVAAALATQATLTVTGVPGAAQAYGATFTVSSSGGSGTGTVTFAASGACSNTAGGALITM